MDDEKKAAEDKANALGLTSATRHAFSPERGRAVTAAFMAALRAGRRHAREQEEDGIALAFDGVMMALRMSSTVADEQATSGDPIDREELDRRMNEVTEAWTTKLREATEHDRADALSTLAMVQSQVATMQNRLTKVLMDDGEVGPVLMLAMLNDKASRIAREAAGETVEGPSLADALRMATGMPTDTQEEEIEEEEEEDSATIDEEALMRAFLN